MADESYPDHWRPQHLRRAEADAKAQHEAAQRQHAEDEIDRASSGCGGHLGAVGLAAPNHEYPAGWQPRHMQGS
jgi:hypothetical protein